ncbi:flavodoxin [Desulfobulbus elongatus]|uniref:flavodoxin n=1 Tax=Desulfobulbus elongatus TaxID=53332 RepID=UPI000482B93C|nr:flavodoxin [Desulfobulbus elongatus]
MSKALIVYGSTTGNTEATAKQIGEVLSQQGVEVTIQDVTRTQVADLGGDFDLTLLGSSTWGDADIEFQEDFAPFYDTLDQANLKGRKVALFGCGDSSYTHFCGAVNMLEEKMEELGAAVVNDPLRIDGDPGDAKSDIVDWAKEVASHA